MLKAKWDQVFRVIAALRSYVITNAEMRQKGDGMDDEGTLKLVMAPPRGMDPRRTLCPQPPCVSV